MKFFLIYISFFIFILNIHSNSETHFSNELQLYNNDISGNGKLQSSLTEGFSYINIFNLYGNGEKEVFNYSYNIGIKITDDSKNDIKNISLTNLQGNFIKDYHIFNFGDIFENFSQYTLATSLKGISYKFLKQNSKLPKIYAIFGNPYPRWDSFWNEPKTKVTKRQVYGLKIKENIGDLEIGGNYLNSKDVELVNENQKFRTSNYSVDFNYIILDGLNLNGEFAKSNGDEKISNKSLNGKALRLEAVGDAEPSRVSIEYENIEPDYTSLLGSAISDRRKIKAKWKYKYSNLVNLNSSLLYYRDNLTNQKKQTTYTYRPEISLSIKKVFSSRPLSYANISYKFDRKYGPASQKDHYFNINYQDKFKDIENDTNIGYTTYKTDPNKRNSSEINFNTSFLKRIDKNDSTITPSLNLGSWYSKDELSNTTDKIYEYSMGLIYEKIQASFNIDFKMGQNFLKKQNSQDSEKTFALINCYYKTRMINYDSTIFLKIAYNNYNFSINSNDFREKSITFGVNTSF
ncbi:MAG: hypothetical protein N2Z20_02720 [Elusimicrobiales bacterium]|nr:hypothetical protein [Elusimicrobiales bacterium]